MRAAANRLGCQASAMRVFDEILILDVEKLTLLIPEFEIILENIKKLDQEPLFYRAIKAYLIDWALDGRFGEFDLIMYSDAGSELINNSFARRNFNRLLETARQTGGVAQHLFGLENQFSKRKLLEFLKVSIFESATPQIQATWSIWKNSDENRTLAKNWVALSDSSLDLWQNPNDLTKESPEYIDHRRDQSIFSILWKRTGNETIPEYRDFRPILSASFPIQNRRNRTGKSVVPRTTKSFIAGLVSSVYTKFYRDLRS